MFSPRFLRGLALALLMSCGNGSDALCSNQVLAEVVSPGAELKAVIFARDCGGAQRSTHISVLPTSVPLPATEGNLYIVDTTYAASEAKAGRSPPIQVEWVGRNRLRIHQEAAARVRKAVSEIAAVRVEYVRGER
jgi:hypothetical protein